MPVFRLNRELVFPPPELAEPDGLLAVGGDLSPQRLLAAYQQGIFPWYSGDEPILWWSLSPRLVLFPEEFHLPRSLARTIKRGIYQVSADTAFAEVIAACAAVRQESGTWINQDMQAAYIRLHELGFAHSVECRFEGELVGGLYGLCLDRMFFGESMFALRDDASKVAVAALVSHARSSGIQAIDCQMTTAHMLRFGSRELDRQAFQELLEQLVQRIQPQERWRLQA
ncbi:leucyl/phenylalanyl-tRNA--protein transferase [Candidatus Electronema sp. JM]|uniref:leucyl/phenylalanyl-tRNA--protein transferase n=1 Tax=Candidatus Electronema sp. JM TaxID=3401571 RepID=UPI003AA87F09